jgi:hypothetical protein
VGAAALLAFVALGVASPIVGRAVGGDTYSPQVWAGPSAYLGAVSPRYAAEAWLRSVELFVSQPAALLALGLAGLVLAGDGRGRGAGLVMWAWLAGALCDVNWGRRYESGSWVVLVPVLALGCGALAARFAEVPASRRERALLLGAAAMVVLMALPRVKVAAGRWRDLAGFAAKPSSDAWAAETILHAARGQPALFIWADTVAAAARCRARLVPPDPNIVYRLAGVWRTEEKTERLAELDDAAAWARWQQAVTREPPDWVVVAVGDPFAQQFGWETYPALQRLLGSRYRLFAAERYRLVFRRSAPSAPTGRATSQGP